MLPVFDQALNWLLAFSPSLYKRYFDWRRQRA